MDSGYYEACSALKAHTSALEIAGYNIANITTTEYSAAQLTNVAPGSWRPPSRRLFCSTVRFHQSLAMSGDSRPREVPSNLSISNTDDDEFAMLRAQVEKALAGEIAGGNVAVRRTQRG